MFKFTENHKIVHKDIRFLIRDFLLDSTKDILHINSFAGSGKTTIAAEELEYSGLHFIYLGNKHDIVKEQQEKQPPFNDLLQIESRQRLCKIQKFKDLAEYGINIKHFCDDCVNKEICEYYFRLLAIWKEPQPWLGVHHHLSGLVNAYIAENDVDVLVIDEYFLDSIYKNFNIKKDILKMSFNIIIAMPKSTIKDIMIEFVKILLKMIGLKINNESENIYKLINSIKNISELIDFSDEFEIILANQYFEIGEIFKNIITPLVYTLKNIWEYNKKFGKTKTIKYIKNVIMFVERKMPNGFILKIPNISYYDIFALNLNCKIIILDATTPSKFYEEVFQRPVKSLVRNISLNTIFYQISRGKYVMQTLDMKNGLAKTRLMNIVEKISKKHKDEKILVISRKKYKDEISKIAPNIITDHYPLSGTNDYDSINVCVIFGTPEPSSIVLRRKTTLLNCDVHTLLYIERESAILQGIHRTRIALKLDKQTYVYLLTSLELPFYNIKKYTIKKLIKLLSIESDLETIIEVEEDIIREQIYEYIKIKPRKLSDIKKEIKDYTEFVKEVLDRMVNDKLLKCIIPLRTTRGRPPTFYMLND